MDLGNLGGNSMLTYGIAIWDEALKIKAASIQVLTQEYIKISNIDETVTAGEVAQAMNRVISPSSVQSEDSRLRQSYRACSG